MESRLATLTLDNDDLSKLPAISSRSDLPSTFQPDNILQLLTTLPALFNALNFRRAILPAANGHCSARALARYYAALADHGVIPPPHSTSSKPPLGSHPHIPKFNLKKTYKQRKGRNTKELNGALSISDSSEQLANYGNSIDSRHDRDTYSDNYVRKPNDNSCSSSNNITTARAELDEGCQNDSKIFSDPGIHDAFLGSGQYENLISPNGDFGLGFKRVKSQDGSLVGFGHSGMGGSTGFCDIKNRFAIAVTVNKISFGAVTANIIKFVCSELNLPIPIEYSGSGERGPNMTVDLEKPIIN